MNQQLIRAKKSSLILLSLLSFSSVAFSEDLQINWLDNSTNEDGFTIEKRLLENETFELVSVLPANSDNYIDSDVMADETYCYRVKAFNRAGESLSEESCMEVVEAQEPVYAPEVILSHQFTSKRRAIEIGDKEFYSFKSGAVYNEWSSDDEIYNVDFSVNKGKLRNKDRRIFRFQQDGVELENGFVRMKFNTANNLSFMLQGYGNKQVATLYMKAKALSDEASSIIVTAGDEVEVITLPDGQRGHFFSIKIEFNDTTAVNITTDSNRKGGLMFAGLVFSESN